MIHFDASVWIRLACSALYVLLAPFFGGLLAGVDRRITARMQGRQGPPVLQPFYDVLKLFEKRRVSVNKLQNFFIVLFFVFLVFTGALFFAGGDLLLFIFAFTLAALFFILAAYAANSPYSSIGAERELLQMMAYEPMVLLTAVGFYMATGSFKVADIVVGDAPAVLLIPALFVGFCYVLTFKFRKSPFDLSTSHHGHQEIVKGITTEFSGSSLALIEIAHWYEATFLIGFLALFFVWSNPLSILLGLAAALLVYFLEILVDNTFARVKWQLAIQSAWIVASVLGFLNLLALTLMNRG